MSTALSNLPPGVSITHQEELVPLTCHNGHEWKAAMYFELGGWFFVKEDDEEHGMYCPVCCLEGRTLDDPKRSEFTPVYWNTMVRRFLHTLRERIRKDATRFPDGRGYKGKRVSVREVCRRTGIPRSTFLTYIHQRSPIPFSKMDAILYALGWSVTDFIYTREAQERLDKNLRDKLANVKLRKSECKTLIRTSKKRSQNP